jgi:hypothetical protein
MSSKPVNKIVKGSGLNTNRAPSNISHTDSPLPLCYDEGSAILTREESEIGPCWEIRKGDSISFPADPAICPNCESPLILWRKVSRSIPDGSGTVDVHLHKPELHCTNDDCDTTVVRLTDNAAEDRS